MKRTFILGDEWLYYKLYCGKRTADTILVDCIKPLTEILLKEKLITKWFFIRYSDPNPHLRIRFQCNGINNLGSIIAYFNNAISAYVANDFVWKIQTDTYTREIERYGKNTIEEAEYLFFIDSNLCVNVLHLIKDDTLLFIFALRCINTIFEVFEFSIEDKLSFVNENLRAFKTEFNSNKTLSKQLYQKYNGLKKEITEFLEVEKHVKYQDLIDLLNTKKKELEIFKKMIVNKNIQDNNGLNQLLSSYLHMTVNRIFRDQQRLHELICYDSLYRFYNSIINQKKQR